MKSRIPHVVRGFIHEFVLPQWRTGLMAAILITLAVILQFIFPLIARHVIDQIVELPTSANLSILISLLIVSVVMSGIFSYSNELITLKLREKIIFNLEVHILKHLHRLPMSFFTKQNSTYLQARVMSDARAVEGVLIKSILTLGISGINFLIGAILVFSFRWQIGVSLVLIIIPYAFVRLYGNEKMRTFSSKMQEQQAMASQAVAESFAGIRTTKVFGREREQDEKLTGDLDCLHKVYVDTNNLAILTNVGTSFVAGLGSVIVLGLGSIYVIQGEMTVGEVFAVLTLVNMTYNPVNNLISTNLNMQKATISIKRIYELLTIPRESSGEKEVEKTKGKIEFKNVHFSYDLNSQVLQGVSFTIQPGQKVAIVGKTGAGKSTISNLILNFYQPTEGSIFIDQVNLKLISLKSVRDMIGIVDQESILFSGTIFDNIRFSKPDASDEDIYKAAISAHANEFINKLNKKYDTVIGERGAQLSSGQVQRILVARLFLKDPCIIILDEALASVDSNSEALIQKALEALLRGRTGIIIAHRLSSLLMADHVIVLDGGKIVEQGSHEELIQAGKHYSQLFQHQFDIRGTLNHKNVQEQKQFVVHT